MSKSLTTLTVFTKLSLTLLVCGLLAQPASAESKQLTLPEIPEALTSFGAAVGNDSLYLYGGHMGSAHSYSTEDQSEKLFAISLTNPSEWEELAPGPKLQGLAMVAHKGSLYRLGGFTARNDEVEEHELWSSAECARFDLKAKTWSPLPSLPEPRSSFDAVVHNGVIYVIGGWAMRGAEGEKTWHKTAWKMNLEKQPLKWEPLPAPSFARRALSTAALGTKIYAIGGMKSKGGPTRDVDIFDIKTQTWSKGPALPGEKGMEGFGNSSFSVGNKLFCSTISGSLYQFTEGGSEWTKALDLPNKRFFHRMVPYQENSLILVGGASMDSGKIDEIDHVLVPTK